MFNGSLTGLVLGFGGVNQEEMAAFYNSRDNLTMKQVVDALINATSPERFMEQERQSQLRPTKNKNLFLLAGHLELADLDAQISVALKVASGIPSIRNIPGNLPAILQNIAADKVEADYIIYDLSPNVGGLNEVMLMSSDYFIVPTSPDYFCLQAIYSLQKNITKWHREIKRFREENGFDHHAFAIKNEPKFLGLIQQRYRPRNEMPAQSFLRWIDSIREATNHVLVPALKNIGCVVDQVAIDKALAGSQLSPYDLGHVSDFNSLIAISQRLAKPIFELTDQEIKEVGKVFGHAERTMKESRDSFHEVFSELGQRVLALTA